MVLWGEGVELKKKSQFTNPYDSNTEFVLIIYPESNKGIFFIDSRRSQNTFELSSIS